MARKPPITDNYKQRVRLLLSRLGELNADYDQILVQCEELRQMCLTGMQQEKVTNKGETVTITEVFPGVALQCVQLKLSVLKELSRIDELEHVEPEVHITLNVGSAEEAAGIEER